MKKIVLTTVVAFSALLLNAQIKNAGFENWSNLHPHVYETEMLDSHNVANPMHGDIDDWTSSIDVGVSQTTDASSGNYAAILHNWYNYGKTTLTYRDTISFYPDQFTGMFKYISDPFSAGNVNVIVKSMTGDTIINSNWYLGYQQEWDSFSLDLIPIMSTSDSADSLFITFHNSEYACQGNIMTCNLLYLDDLSLSLGAASIEESSFGEMRIFPNPAKENVTLQFPDRTDYEDLEVSLLDMTGKTVLTHKVEGVESVLDIHQLDAGTYVVRVQTASGKTSRRSLVIQ